jgi:hypothetical protein
MIVGLNRRWAELAPLGAAISAICGIYHNYGKSNKYFY